MLPAHRRFFMTRPVQCIFPHYGGHGPVGGRGRHIIDASTLFEGLPLPYCHDPCNEFFRLAEAGYDHFLSLTGFLYIGFGLFGQERRKLTRFPALPDSDTISFPCKNRKCVLKFLNRCSG